MIEIREELWLLDRWASFTVIMMMIMMIIVSLGGLNWPDGRDWAMGFAAVFCLRMVLGLHRIDRISRS